MEPTPPPRSLRVFLCHSSGDKPAVRDLYHRLQNDGIKPWLDEEDLLPGQDWQQEIPKAVRASDIVIVCLSRAAITKAGYVQKEIKYALDVADEQPESTIFIIPLRLEECDVPERLSRWQWVNLFEKTGYARLIRSLRLQADLLGVSATPYSPSLQGITVDVNRRQVWVDGHLVTSSLSRLEFALLEYLARHAGHVCHREDIMEWLYPGENRLYGDAQRLDTVLRRVRIALGRNVPYLVTHRGVGIQMTEGRIIK